MQVNVKEFLKDSGISEPFYPGKRLVQACRQPGEFKSHCVVLDWRQNGKIRIDVKAGLTGKDLPVKDLKYYPVSFQSPTYIEIEVGNDNSEGDEDKEGSKGKSSGGGGKSPAKKLGHAFGTVTEGKIPVAGKIVELVVAGMKIAEQAYESVMQTLVHQIKHTKICATSLLAEAGDFITRYTPPAFLKPRGDETAVYKYDREKNANIGYKPALG